MDFQVSVPSPFTYLVHEHARSILAIQELQREVTSLLEFRDNVLHALPHLHARAYHSLTSTHDPVSAPQVSQPPQASPITRGEPSPSKSSHASHHMTSAESGRQQRPISSAGGVTATTNSGNSSSSSSSTGGKSLSETHSSAVADSGFSTDKAGGSMGKSSSSSAGDHLSGAEEHRWTSVEPELPLGSAEDELWQLLDVIQRKGTRLRNELERAERAERERVSQPPPNASSVSDPLTSPRPHSTYQDFWPHSLPGPIGSYPSRGDILPPPPPPPPVGMGMEAEAWAAVDRLRQDRQYLVGRVNWAEAEAAASHQRLLDLHGQLLALAGDKRRLEDQVRALRLDPRIDPRPDPRTDSRLDFRNDLNLQFVKTNGVRRDGPASTGGIVHSVMGGVNTVHIVSDNTTSTTNTSSTKSRRVPPAVTVSVASGEGEDLLNAGGSGRGRIVRSASSVRINNERDVVLPRVLKVPIRDRTQRHSKHESDSKDGNTTLNYKENKKDIISTNKDLDSNLREGHSNSKDSNFTSTSDTKGSDRVVIERERRAGKADGGLSMPVSLLKGGRVKVQPNKQRISAILREKDMIELQRQLLTTVMETEVLKKQIETAGEEWVNKTAEWEAEHRYSHATITALRQENLSLKIRLDERDKVHRKDASISAQPTSVSVATMTEGGGMDIAEAATHTVHPGPNIKYDVVVHEDEPRGPTEANNNAVSSAAAEAVGRKAPPTVEKPPRRCRESRPSGNAGTWNSNHSNQTGGQLGRRESSGSEVSGGRDSLNRGATLRHRSNMVQTGRSTPTVTPRSSPAPSIGTRTGVSRVSNQDGNRTSILGRNGSTSTSNRMVLGRRDSLKTNQGNSSGNGKTNGGSGGQHKDSPIFHSDQSIINKSSPVMFGDKASRLACSSRSSLDGSNSPLALSDLRSPSPPSFPMSSQGKLFIKKEDHGKKLLENVIDKSFHKRLSASDVYNCELRDIDNQVQGDKNNRKLSSTIQKNRRSFEKRDSCTSDLNLSNLKSGSESSLSSITSTGSYYDSINTDSNNMDDSSKLMHVEVAFEWNPISTKEIRYLPPAAHMWNPDHTLSPDKRLPPVRNTLCSVAPGWIPATKQPGVFGHQTALSSDSVSNSSSSVITNHSSGNSYLHGSKYHCSADSLEDDHHHRFEAMGKMRNKLKGMNGAVRVKNVDRPSVLSMAQGPTESNNHLNVNREAFYSTRSYSNSPKTSSVDQDCNIFETNIADSLDRPAAAQIHVGRHGSASVQCENAPVTNNNADLDSRVRQILARIAASAQ